MRIADSAKKAYMWRPVRSANQQLRTENEVLKQDNAVLRDSINLLTQQVNKLQSKLIHNYFIHIFDKDIY